MLVLIVKFVLLIVSGTYAAPCPETCNCRQFPKDSDIITDFQNNNNLIFIEVSCTGNVREKLPESTEVLLLRNMLESDLKSFLTTLNGNLKDIIVTDVNLANASFTFNLTAINQLKSLKLSNCDIVSSPRFIITNSTKIQSLDLSNNQLKSFNIQLVQTLEVLNLSANVIDSLNANSFTGLISLKSLDLTGNMLSTIDDKVLKPLISLQHLNLSRNRLEILNEASFTSLLHLQQLDVSWNRLAKVAPGSLQLPSLARLLLAGNPNLGNFQQPALLVGTGRRLQTVDASRTGLKQVPAALTHSIRTLRLAGNSITAVNCGDLDSYPLLQLLDFTSNNLENIEDDALGRLDSLYVLYLTDNKLRSIPRSLPERLRVLHLEKNKIEQIRNVDLQGLPLLEVLLLSDNKIKVVEENSFIQLISLETLDLSTNPINILKAGIFAGPIQLRVLRLSRIQAIPPAKEMTFPLSSPEHLVILDLSKSPGLARQLLADTAVLAATHELQELDLSDSFISHIRSDLLHFLPQLRIFRLHGNPLNCTNLQWLASWMRKQDDLEYRNVICTSPHDLWGTLLVDLLEEEESDSFITESIINQNVTNVSYDIRGNKVTTANVDGITTVYNTSGNETSMKLFEMNDDETSTVNYTTRTSEILLNNYHTTNSTIVNETSNLFKMNKENLLRNNQKLFNNNDDLQRNTNNEKIRRNNINEKMEKNNNNKEKLFNNGKLLSIYYNNGTILNNANSTKIFHNNVNEIIKKNNLTNSIMNNKLKNFKNSTKLNTFTDKHYKNEINLTLSHNSNFTPLRKELNENVTNLWTKNFKLFSQQTKNVTTINESVTQNNKSTNAEDYKKILDKEISSLNQNDNNNKFPQYERINSNQKSGNYQNDDTNRINGINTKENASVHEKIDAINNEMKDATIINDKLLATINEKERATINENERATIKVTEDASMNNKEIVTITENDTTINGKENSTDVKEGVKITDKESVVINGNHNRKEDIYDELNVTSSNGKTSMYSGENHQLKDVKKFSHPGMLILIIGIILAAVALITVTSRFSWLRSKTTNNISRSNSFEDVEVSSIPSVTELW